MASQVRWSGEPAEHDFPAALDYLTLLLDAATAAQVIADLRSAPTVTRKAKDLLRASRLPLLPVDDAEVARDRKRVKKGVPLSPVLLVRGAMGGDRPLVVADGYHRICAGYHLADDVPIHCRIADLRARSPAKGPAQGGQRGSSGGRLLSSHPVHSLG